MRSHWSIAVAGIANRMSDNSPAAESTAGEVEEDGHLMVMVMMVVTIYVGLV